MERRTAGTLRMPGMVAVCSETLAVEREGSNMTGIKCFGGAGAREQEAVAQHAGVYNFAWECLFLQPEMAVLAVFNGGSLGEKGT